MAPFENRKEAGLKLAERLKSIKLDRPVVLALPRGGVPVALEIAKVLNAPLDLTFVRKIGAPGQPELAIGAVTDGDEPKVTLNEELARITGANKAYIESEAEKKLAEIERRQKVYLKDRSRVDLTGRTVILVDDGIATGASVRTALQVLRKQNPDKVILAIPVAATDTLAKIRSEADEIICLQTPDPFIAIGVHYRHFDQIKDDQVIALLAEADGIPFQ